jgi:hypothetical protein
MAYEMKPGQGSAWPNENKTEDWHADFRGKVMLPDGRTHYLDINPKESDGKTWYSVKVGKEVMAPQQAYSAAHQPFAVQPTPSPSASNKLDDPDGDIPF